MGTECLVTSYGTATLAIDHYLKYKELLGIHEYETWALVLADVNIVDVKAEMPSMDTVSVMNDKLELFENFYTLSKQGFGVNSAVALCAGNRLFNALCKQTQNTQ